MSQVSTNGVVAGIEREQGKHRPRSKTDPVYLIMRLSGNKERGEDRNDHGRKNGMIHLLLSLRRNSVRDDSVFDSEVFKQMQRFLRVAHDEDLRSSADGRKLVMEIDVLRTLGGDGK